MQILAVAASVFPEDRRRVADAGMDGFLAKPFTLAALRDVLEATLHAPRQPSAGEPEEKVGSTASRARELPL
jgi:CheY-like chemotaxis protein